MRSSMVKASSLECLDSGISRQEKPRPWRKRFGILLWVAIPVFLWWSFRNTSLDQVLDTLRHLNPTAIAILILLNTTILAMLTSRWWLILRAQGFDKPFRSLIGYRLAAFGVTYFTPGPQMGGEPLQVYLLQRREEIPQATAMASVTLDKLLELLANFTFLVVGVSTMLATGFGGGQYHLGLIAFPLTLLAIPCVYLFALRKRQLPISRIVERLAKLSPDSANLKKADLVVTAAEEQVAEFCRLQPAKVFLALLMSLLTWLFVILEFALTLRFLGLQLSLPQVIIILTAARIAFLLPIPAGLGTLEAGQVFTLGIFGVNPAVGLSLSLLIRVRDAALAMFGLWWGGALTR